MSSPRPTASLISPGTSRLGRQRAVTVGINYLGLPCQLGGCINDSHTFVELLTNEFGYDVSCIRQLRDDNVHGRPTRKNITTALKWLVNGAAVGDHLFFHYSGHGSQQEDTDGDEMSGRDDTLVPVDYQQAGMLSDDELRSILVSNLPEGVRLAVILDCCHSGTALDLPYKVMVDGQGVNSGLQVKKKLTHQMKPQSKGNVVLLSGCKDTQTSADAGVGLAGNSQPAGAMTTAFRVTMTGHKDIAFKDLLFQIRSFLQHQGLKQVPQLSSEWALDLSLPFMPECAPAKVLCPPASRPPVRKGLTIGVNYYTLPKGHGQLSGCIDDSDTVIGIWKDHFGFQDSHICRLRDDRPELMPTKAHMLAAFRWLTSGAQPGDELFLHYSGHGGRQRDKNGDEASGQDSTLIPCDFQTSGQLVDDELYTHLVQPLPKGVHMWVIMDCCHSGTALDLPFRVEIDEADGRTMKCSETSRTSSSAPISPASVLMISGCKDSQTAADVQAGSMGMAKASGVMTTAFKHCMSGTATCQDLLMGMRTFLKENGFVQTPQMSSNTFLQLDCKFAHYGSMKTGSRPAPIPAVASPASTPAPPLHPQATAGHSQAEAHHHSILPTHSHSTVSGFTPSSLSPSIYQSHAVFHHTPNYYHYSHPASAQASSEQQQQQQQQLLSPMSSSSHTAASAGPGLGFGQASPDGACLDEEVSSRISTLEQQIAELRKHRAAAAAAAAAQSQTRYTHQPMVGSPGIWHSTGVFGQSGKSSQSTGHSSPYAPYGRHWS